MAHIYPCNSSVSEQNAFLLMQMKKMVKKVMFAPDGLLETEFGVFGAILCWAWNIDNDDQADRNLTAKRANFCVNKVQEKLVSLGVKLPTLAKDVRKFADIFAISSKDHCNFKYYYELFASAIGSKELNKCPHLELMGWAIIKELHSAYKSGKAMKFAKVWESALGNAYSCNIDGGKCYNCYHNGHQIDKCPYSVICYNCGQEGHFARRCYF